MSSRHHRLRLSESVSLTCGTKQNTCVCACARACVCSSKNESGQCPGAKVVMTGTDHLEPW